MDTKLFHLYNFIESQPFNKLAAYYLFSGFHFLLGSSDALVLSTTTTVTFLTGSSGTTNQCREFTITDDTILEGNEDFTVEITGATPEVSTAIATIVNGSSTTIVTINDNDSKYICYNFYSHNLKTFLQT